MNSQRRLDLCRQQPMPRNIDRIYSRAHHSKIQHSKAWKHTVNMTLGPWWRRHPYRFHWRTYLVGLGVTVLMTLDETCDGGLFLECKDTSDVIPCEDFDSLDGIELWRTYNSGNGIEDGRLGRCRLCLDQENNNRTGLPLRRVYRRLFPLDSAPTGQ